jgi:tetratricopeptide (TPR) repeat protein
MIRIILPIAVFCASLTGAYKSFTELNKFKKTSYSDTEQKAELLFLPQQSAVEFVSFGYKHALSHFLWFVAINYFGKHYEGDRNYRWLYHMCDLVTKLNPHNADAFEFCGTMLAWEYSHPEESIAILSSAIQAQPKNWKFYYFRGFTYLYFLKDDVKASQDFVAASKLPNVHPIVVSLAAMKLSQTNGPQEAIQHLRDVLETSDDPFFKRVINAKILELQKKYSIK